METVALLWYEGFKYTELIDVFDTKETAEQYLQKISSVRPYRIEVRDIIKG